MQELQLSASSFVVKLHTHTKQYHQTKRGSHTTALRVTRKRVLGVHEPDTLNSLRRKRPEHERKKNLHQVQHAFKIKIRAIKHSTSTLPENRKPCSALLSSRSTCCIQLPILLTRASIAISTPTIFSTRNFNYPHSPLRSHLPNSPVTSQPPRSLATRPVQRILLLQLYPTTSHSRTSLSLSSSLSLSQTHGATTIESSSSRN